MNDTPQISSSSYMSTTTDTGMLWNAGDQVTHDPLLEQFLRNSPEFSSITTQQTKNQESMANPSRRMVQVFIADPNDNVPLNESVLFKGEQKLTDLTDSELFFEVPISQTLEKHNEKRIKWLDKEASKRAGKDVPLDPVRIRELKMVVVTIAQF